jgi:hypothetical protein
VAKKKKDSENVEVVREDEVKEQPSKTDIPSNAIDPQGIETDEAPPSRKIAVAGTPLGEPIEPSKDSIVPLPEKPKLAVGEVSVRALNQLPDGAELPPATEKTPSARQAVHAAQARARGEDPDEPGPPATKDEDDE